MNNPDLTPSEVAPQPTTPADDGKVRPDPTRRVSDWVAERILDRIGHGDLEPGQRLPGERQLAEQLNVSRVSVRAALQKLKTQGFLTAVQGGGTRVVSSAGAMDAALTEMVRVKLENLYDLVEIRMALETWAARRAAERASADQLDAIGRIVSLMDRPGRNRTDDDFDFHLAIGRAAGSPVYLHILSTIREILGQMVEFHHSPVFAEGREDTMLRHHRAIYEALSRRAPDDAAEAIRTHLGWVLERYRQIQPPGTAAPHPAAPPDGADDGE
ncbi:FadR/GntR family transcriptional regulator [Azospirillum halopraeferens]|uniref:FadR/GntR family transcriptional regulator n=1 Tax=Azospirillum halopraeferens TaxID=34010 RepID=UPI00040E7BFE|nr:FadR/GntR family transcriptional regulator [Azospirillum halopraeferens]